MNNVAIRSCRVCLKMKRLDSFDLERIHFRRPVTQQAPSERFFRIGVQQEKRDLIIQLSRVILTPFYDKVAVMLPLEDSSVDLIVALDKFVTKQLNRKRKLGVMLTTDFGIVGRRFKDRFRYSTKTLTSNDRYMCVGKTPGLVVYDANKTPTARSFFEKPVKIILRMSCLWVYKNTDGVSLRSVGCQWDIIQVGVLPSMALQYLFHRTVDAGTQTDQVAHDTGDVSKPTPALDRPIIRRRPVFITPSMLTGITLAVGSGEECLKSVNNSEGHGVSVSMLNSICLKKTTRTPKPKLKKESYLERVLKERFKNVKLHF